MSKIDWIAIKNEYINTNTSYRKLAEKYGINKDTIAKRAQSENWIKAKDKQADKIQAKIIQQTANRIVTKEVNRIDRIVTLADDLLKKAEQAISELDCHMVANRNITKVSEDATEITTEKKTLSMMQGIIKTSELKQLASALKDIKDIQASLIENTNNSEVSALLDTLEDESE